MDDSEMADDTKTAADIEDEKSNAHDTEQEEHEEIAAAHTEIDEAEAQKKRSAMDVLASIEKDFAAFRDKLHDERLTQLTHELAVLDGPNAMHPEFQAMLQCIDARRDEKIQHELIALQYDLKSLERRSVAERSQIHGEFFQNARDVRERHLYRIGEQWYQIQQDRRRSEEGVSDYMLQFPSHRPKQISQQNAYNHEVSILSGFAKYVGFPAAPEIESVKASDIQDDLLKMGIINQTGISSTPQSSVVRIPMSSTSVYKKPAAEEQFIEQTPWANPHHPIHQQRLQQAQSQNDVHMKSPITGATGIKRKVGFDAVPRDNEDTSSKSKAATTAPASIVVNTSSSGEAKQRARNFGTEENINAPTTSHNDEEYIQRRILEEPASAAPQRTSSTQQADPSSEMLSPQAKSMRMDTSRAGDSLDPGGNTMGSALMPPRGTQNLVATVVGGSFS